MSEQHVYEAWGAVMRDLSERGIGKTSRNEHQKYNFRGIDAVINELSTSLVRNRLAVLPSYGSIVSEPAGTTKSGASNTRVTLVGTFALISTKDGSRIDGLAFAGEGFDSADKATNKAMSAAYKYFAIQTFAIPTEGMLDDSDRDNGPDQQRQPQKRAAPAIRVEGKLKPLTECTVDEMRDAYEKANKILDSAERRDLHATARDVLDNIDAEMADRASVNR